MTSLSPGARHECIVSSDNERCKELTASVIAGSSSILRASLEIYGRARETIDLRDQDIDDDRRLHANYFFKRESTRIIIVALPSTGLNLKHNSKYTI